MKSDWKSFLTEMGAIVSSDKVTDFEKSGHERRAVTDEPLLCDLSHLGLIRVSGEDTTQFLNSQFSNDITEVSEHHSQLNAYCNPKGRMLATFRVFKRGDDYFLRLPGEILEETLRRLRMFVLRSKVELSDASDSLVRVGFYGENANERLLSCVDRVPQSINDCVTAPNLSVIRIHGIQPRFEIHGNTEAVKGVWRALSKEAIPAGASAWALLDILAGIPTVRSETREAFVPQMANLDLIGGLSFKKGCYPGQEIVARMHYLGRLKRRMYLIHLADGGSARAGEELFIKGMDGDQAVGKIVDACAHPNGGSAALAVIQIEKAQRDTLSLCTKDGSDVTFKSLPYALSPV